MGNRVQLAFGACCEFEANNCIPVTWLALFESTEFLVERRVDEPAQHAQRPAEQPQAGAFHKFLLAIRRAFGRNLEKTGGDRESQSQALREPEEYDVAVYRTSKLQAVRRVESAIGSLKGSTPIWAFLRPLEILRDELHLCSEETVELDVSQFWAINKAFEQRVSQAPDELTRLLNGLTGDGEQDLAALTRLINLYSRTQISSVADLDPEDRIFVLIGTYGGDQEREAKYSPEHFGAAYWARGETG